MENDIEVYAQDLGELSEISWTGDDNMTYDEWCAYGRTMQQIGRSLNWWLGDWLVHGERRWGETYAQAIEMSGQALETLKKYKAVSDRVNPKVRRRTLSWTHHFYICYLPPEEHEILLDIAEQLELPSRDFKELANLRPEERAKLAELHVQGKLSINSYSRILQLVKMDRDYQEDPKDQEEAGSEKEEECEDEHEDEDFSPPANMDPETRDMISEYWYSKGNPVELKFNRAMWKGVTVRAVLCNGIPELQWEIAIG